MMFCAIWYHLYNLKNVKNTHGRVLHLEVSAFSLQLKVKLFHVCFSRFLIVQIIANRATHHILWQSFKSTVSNLS